LKSIPSRCPSRAENSCQKLISHLIHRIITS
jgi:hypothetical protein